ncbi:histidine kinase [bacterium]|nr:histidine kinase [bacterium]MBU1063625.1 histidine kinase [bacterium]MBU1633254.1 histidine kinase [bacterium]MBU1875419.1 histidine kinase [bacterium]
MKLLKSLLIFQCLFSFIQGQTGEITFNVVAVNSSSNLPLFICGNHKNLADWNPGLVSLNQVSDSLWIIGLTFPINSVIEYKFTRGSWDTEPVDDTGNPFSNFTLTVTNDTVIFHRFEHWNKKVNPAENTITGTIIHHEAQKYRNLLPRDVHVWLPPGYDNQPDRHYPVLYMHDGQNLFNARTASFGNEWRIDEIADSLIQAGRIEPLIIVGIDNTNQRTEEYSLTETGNNYQHFVIDELKPFIDKKYRTIPDREHTAVGGSSLGGLIAFIFAWDYDQIFSKAICMSPAFKIEEFDIVTPIQEYIGPQKDIRLYIDNGGIELEQLLQPGIFEMLETLNKQGYQQNTDYLWVNDPTAEHSEKAWSKRLPLALTFLFGK